MADSTEQYVAAAVERLLELFESELALLKPEAIARLSERFNRGERGNLDSHIVGLALDRLIDEGTIIRQTATSRGGHRVTTYEPANQHLRATAIAAAARRKRLLMAQYLSWAQGTRRYPQGFIGPAGEEATRGGILLSAALQPAAPGAAGVPSLLGVRLPGPADSAGYMTTFASDGSPGTPVTLVFEVKSLRQWIYPNNTEIYQVLDKCATLKGARPSAKVVPVLVCRRAHPTTFWFAQQLGMFVIEMDAQYIGNHVDEGTYLTVRNELAFRDLQLGNGPSLRIRDRLGKLPPHAERAADQWAETANDTKAVQLIHALRAAKQPALQDLLNDLRTRNEQLGRRGGW